MTASTAEKTTAKRGRPADSEADKVDLSGLTFEPADAPARKKEPNPFEVPLGESYETETARATKIPAVALRRVEGMLRRAADELKIGVSIAATDPDEDGKVTVTFMGKDRRKRKTNADGSKDSGGNGESDPNPVAPATADGAPSPDTTPAP